jgi:xanthine/CO dehydrogenase XdhC/CoxF family maturation factor
MSKITSSGTIKVSVEAVCQDITVIPLAMNDAKHARHPSTPMKIPNPLVNYANRESTRQPDLLRQILLRVSLVNAPRMVMEKAKHVKRALLEHMAELINTLVASCLTVVFSVPRDNTKMNCNN